MSNLTKILNDFHQETTDLLYASSTIDTVEIDCNDIQWPLKFYQSYVSKNKPVLIKHGFDDFAALRKWSANYLLENIPDKLTKVAVTPTGFADAVFKQNNGEEIFVLPDEVLMTMREFLQNLHNPKDNYVCYIQQQNSNLQRDFKELVPDVSLELEWASRAFDKKPDAVNFWMGDQRATSSLHKDYYENIYCVINGYKDFILIPPTDLPKITYKNYQVGKFCNVTHDSYQVRKELNEFGQIKKVPWIANDPLKTSNKESLKNFSSCHMYKVRVEKGDCLYLPCLWFHHVQQSHGCMAINYWYDMEFDAKYCYYQLLQSLLTTFE